MTKIQTNQIYNLIIKPALLPKERHKIEDAVKKLGYEITGGGTNTDMSQSDFSFKRG